MASAKSASKASPAFTSTTSNPLVTGMPTATTSQSGFTSKQEMVTAMADKRYGRDMSYTREVQTKVKMSNIFG